MMDDYEHSDSPMYEINCQSYRKLFISIQEDKRKYQKRWLSLLRVSMFEKVKNNRQDYFYFSSSQTHSPILHFGFQSLTFVRQTTINSFFFLIQTQMIILFTICNIQIYFIMYRRTSPYKSAQNPEVPTTHVVKLQKLLQQYDQQNAFLNQQIVQLLRRNRELERTSVEDNIDSLRKRRQQNRGIQRQTQRKKYMSGQKKYHYTEGYDTELKRIRNRINAETQHKYEKQNYKETVTKEPYLQEEEYINTNQVKSILKANKNNEGQTNKNVSFQKQNNQYDGAQLSPIKKGIQLIEKKSLSKQKIEELSESKLSRKSSKRSGIKVYSPKKDAKQPEQVKQSKKEEFQKEQKIVEVKPVKNQDEPKTEVKNSQAVKFIYTEMSLKNQLQTQKNIQQTTDRGRRVIDEDINKYSGQLSQRKQSQHKINPTRVSYHTSLDRNQSQGQRKRESQSVQGKKKFISLVCKSIVDLKQKKV